MYTLNHVRIEFRYVWNFIT